MQPASWGRVQTALVGCLWKAAGGRLGGQKLRLILIRGRPPGNRIMAPAPDPWVITWPNKTVTRLIKIVPSSSWWRDEHQIANTSQLSEMWSVFQTSQSFRVFSQCHQIIVIIVCICLKLCNMLLINLCFTRSKGFCPNWSYQTFCHNWSYQSLCKIEMIKCVCVGVAVQKNKLLHGEECFQVFAILDERMSAGEAWRKNLLRGRVTPRSSLFSHALKHWQGATNISEELAKTARSALGWLWRGRKRFLQRATPQ